MTHYQLIINDKWIVLMLISHRKKFIYLKTVKTASTSVELYFEPYCMKKGEWIFSHGREEYISKDGIIGYRGADSTGKKWYNHMPAYEIKNKISKDIWDTYYKFCVIRNPFDKLVSAFFYFEKDKEESSYFSNLLTNIRRIGKNKQRLKSEDREVLINNFRSWVKSGDVFVDNDKYTMDNQLCVDYFIKFEDLHGGVKHVCDQLCLPFDLQKLPRLKVTSRDNGFGLNEFYDKETEEMVYQLYEFEIRRFGYSLPTS